MKKICLLLCLLSLAGRLAAGQFQLYNEFVNKAELAITGNDYTMALNWYEQAFLYKRQPFASDLYNAALVALQARSFDKAMRFCEQLAGTGVGAAFFEKKQVFVSLRDQKGWKHLLQTASEKQADFREKNKYITPQLQALVDIDQEMHRAWSNSDYNHDLYMKMAALDDSVAHALTDLFNRYGYLSEDKTGANMSSDTVLAYYPLSFIIILHNYQGLYDTQDTLFTPVLRKALGDGLISPYYFACLQDMGSSMKGKTSYGSQGQLTKYKCTLYRDTSTYFHEEWKAARLAIGLPTLEEQEKKMLFNDIHTELEFRIGGYSHRVGSFANEASEKSFLERMVVVIDKLPSCD